MRVGATIGILATVLLTQKVHASPQGGCQPTADINQVMAAVKYVNAPDSLTLQANLNDVKFPLTLDTQNGSSDFTFFYSDLSPARKFGDLKFTPYLEGWTFTPSGLPVCESKTVSGRTVLVARYRFDASRGWWRFELASQSGPPVPFTCQDRAGATLCPPQARTKEMSLPIPAYVTSVSIIAKYNAACTLSMEIKSTEFERLKNGVPFSQSGCIPLIQFLFLPKFVATKVQR